MRSKPKFSWSTFTPSRGLLCSTSVAPADAAASAGSAASAAAMPAGRRAPSVLAAAALLLSTAVWAAPPQPLDAVAARAAIAAGAVVWDLRSTGAVLPGALRVEPSALAAWQERGDVAALSQAVSAAGINMSARVLLVADSDEQARALAPRLAALSRGQVAWLVGGVQSWLAAGGRLQAQPGSRLPMPQQLVALSTEAAAEPADAARRRTATYAMHEPLPTWNARLAVPVQSAAVQASAR
jgi:hypothetical protein